VLYRCQSDRVGAKIVNGIVSSQERVTQNYEWASWLWNIHTGKCGDAAAASFEDIVKGTDSEVRLVECEGKVRKTVTLLALNGVLTREGSFSTDLIVSVDERLEKMPKVDGIRKLTRARQ
jgi:hypothetical protein